MGGIQLNVHVELNVRVQKKITLILIKSILWYLIIIGTRIHSVYKIKWNCH